MTMSCEHRYIYQGTVYWHEDYPISGSGAYARVYGDRYYCERCLDTVIRNQRTQGNSYYNPIAGTLPR